MQLVYPNVSLICCSSFGECNWILAAHVVGFLIIMSSHVGLLRFGFPAADLIVANNNSAAAAAEASSLVPCSSSSGLGVALLCTSGRGCSRLRTSGRTKAGPVSSSICSGRDATEEVEKVVSRSSSSELVSCDGDGDGDGGRGVTTGGKWMVAALAAMVVFGAGEPAMAFGWFGQPQMEKDPVEPFTLYGSILKKYLIEDVVENKVVGRKKGFTASACVNALDASKETPELQGVPAGLKVTIIGEPSCSKGQGQTREESCTAPCRKACQGAVTRHLTEVKEETGYVLEQSDIKKVTETCSVQCFNECLHNKSCMKMITF